MERKTNVMGCEAFCISLTKDSPGMSMYTSYTPVAAAFVAAAQGPTVMVSLKVPQSLESVPGGQLSR